MKSICVFCGSSMGLRNSYREVATNLAEAILDNNYSLVYGGANVGLMKILAQTVLDGGGKVIGIMPRRLVEKEVAHSGLTEMHIVESMSERKSLMVRLSDAFVAMPGGFGTLDEMFEVITYNQLRIVDKPIGILNTDAYFDKLLSFIHHTVNEGFIRKEHIDNLIVENNIAELFKKLSEFQPVETGKWIKDIKNESRL